MIKIYDFNIDGNYFFNCVRTSNLIFGWKIQSNDKLIQECFKIEIYEKDDIIFDSKYIFTTNNFNICFDNLLLKNRHNYRVVLKVKMSNGEEGKFNTEIITEVEKNFWDNASWIKPKKYISGWAPYLRTSFSANNIVKAVMYASGLGIGKYFINGESIEDYYLDPPMTNYEDKIFYRTFDITKYINEGGNAVAVLLGEGFYSQDRAWRFYDSTSYGNVCAIIKIILTDKDDNNFEVVSNTKMWKYKYSPITLNNIYGGEIYDARLNIDDFSLYNFNEIGWDNVIEENREGKNLVACTIPPVRIVKTIKVNNITPCNGIKDGAWIIDIGENIAGFVKVKFLPSPAGTTCVLRYAETLDNFHLDYRSTGAYANQMLQQDIYICNGNSNGEVYQSTLTYHGFRYIEITGAHDLTDGYGTLPKLEIEVYQISTDFDAVSSFECENKDFNKLYEIMNRTYRSNFIGFPTDNCTRERCGWLCDAYCGSDFGLLNYNSVSSYKKYVDDIISSSRIYGKFTNIAPGKRTNHQAFPEFGSAIIYIPYKIYKYYGDTEVLENSFYYMDKWVDYLEKNSVDYIPNNSFGDWDSATGNESELRMPKEHCGAFVFYDICNIMAKVCLVLKNGHADKYKRIADKIYSSVLQKFYDIANDSFGYVGSDAMALYTGLYPQDKKQELLNSLISLIEKNKYYIVTGMPATKCVFSVLVNNGYGDYAVKYLFNESIYSYKNMLNNDATAIWEMLSLGNSNDRGTYVLTFNQPMHGMFLSSVITDVVGIKPAEAGFKRFEFAPQDIKLLGDFSCKFGAISGDIFVNKKGNIFELIIPCNSMAIIKKSCKINGKISNNEISLTSGKYKIEF